MDGFTTPSSEAHRVTDEQILHANIGDAINMKYKLFIIFVTLILLPTLALSYGYYLNTTTTAQDNVTQAMLQTLTQITFNMENTLDFVEQASDNLFFNKDVMAFVGPENNDDILLQIKQAEPVRDLLYTLQMDERIFRVRISVDKKKVISAERVNFFPVEEDMQLPWYAQTISRYGAPVWFSTAPEMGVLDARDVWVVSCRRVLKHSSHFAANDGILSIDIRESTLYSWLSNIQLRKSESIFVVDALGNMVSGLDKTLLGQPVLTPEMLLQVYDAKSGIIGPEDTNTGEVLVFTTISNTGWKLISRIENKYLLENYSFGDLHLVILFVVVLLLFVAASFIIINYITHNITMRMNRVAERIEKEGVLAATEGGDPAKPGRDNDLDKVETLVYEMIRRSNQLAAETYEARIEERRAQLIALQAQINPHFLYNTLDCISWMAVQRDALDVSAMVTMLAKYFRLTLSKGKSTVTVADEIGLARTYLTIQNMRFDNAIRVSINLESDAAEYAIPNLTLQPIVENAVLHGIMKKPEKSGEIAITASVLPDEVRIVVHDDGVGMEQDQLLQLLDQNRNGHYGLRNVSERIKLYFGDAYGFSVASQPGGGTTVTLHLGKREMSADTTDTKYY